MVPKRNRSEVSAVGRFGGLLVATLAGAVAVATGPPTRLHATSTTYYVSTTGSDSNPGSEAAPFRTIQRAANLVNPGDTVIVEDGTYTGDSAGTVCASSTQPSIVCLARGGTSTAWVTFRARNALAAKIDGRSNTSTYGFRFAADFIRVEGFDVFGMGNPTYDAAGFVIYEGGRDVVIARNAIHDIGRLCTGHQFGMNGIFVQNARVTIEANRIYNIGRLAAGENGCNPPNNFYQNHDHGIYLNGRNAGAAAGARDIRVVNNVFANNARGWAIQLYQDSVENLSILHNTFVQPNPYRVGHIIVAANTVNARIIGNIFFEPTTAGIHFYSGVHTGSAVTNNLSSRALSDAKPANVVFSGNLESTDPLLTAELRPSVNSPAVNGSVTLSDVRTDIVGVARPNGPSSDVGAYEVITSPAPPAAPTNLRISR